MSYNTVVVFLLALYIRIVHCALYVETAENIFRSMDPALGFPKSGAEEFEVRQQGGSGHLSVHDNVTLMDEFMTGASDTAARTDDDDEYINVPNKRKRGRPPKNRTVSSQPGSSHATNQPPKPVFNFRIPPAKVVGAKVTTNSSQTVRTDRNVNSSEFIFTPNSDQQSLANLGGPYVSLSNSFDLLTDNTNEVVMTKDVPKNRRIQEFRKSKFTVPNTLT